ncbi:polymorphic toxin-type HINT domain-containing protein, partial [Allorhizocola rhizosphaerae]|uniref:polymorphic toxin-type HINT domain-containing protein n=1 Tax=Allorhizocola rhizosphaerae TaxID=1872709 RepID=UPI002482693F
DLASGGGSVLGTRYYAGIAVRDPTGLKWICTNHQKTSVAQIDAVTLSATRRRMLPYGEDRGTPPTGWMGTKGYVGGTKDTTGYTHLGAREYDPTLGRFISVDPLMDLTDPQQWHAYTYANGNPTTFSDPSGLMKKEPGDRNSPTAPINPGPGEPGGPKVPGGGGGTPKPTKPGNCPPYLVNPNCGSGGIVRAVAEGTTACDIYFNAPVCADATAIQNAANAQQAQQLLVSIQLFLAFAGMVPGVGEIADGVDVIIALSVGDTAGALMSLGAMIPFIGWAAGVGRIGDLGTDLYRACNSFDPETEILLAEGGTKKIKDVQVGDEVLATDPETGETKPKAVTQLHVNQDKQLTLVTVVDEDGNQYVIDTTWEHPFWTKTRRTWTPAAGLSSNEHLLTADGKQLTVAKVINYLGSKIMHNLTVADIHTYYVLAGNTPVLVHNTGPGGCGPTARFVTDANGVTIDLQPLGRGSTGRTTANNLNEQLAMHSVMSNPMGGTIVPLKKGMTDPRWMGTDGWVKMTQRVNGIEIHYVMNRTTGQVDDYKFVG